MERRMKRERYARLFFSTVAVLLWVAALACMEPDPLCTSGKQPLRCVER
jgi:hypothetical protein